MHERHSSLLQRATLPAFPIPVALFVESDNCRDIFFLEEGVVVLGGEGAVSIEQPGLATALRPRECEAPVFNNVVKVTVLHLLHVLVPVEKGEQCAEICTHTRFGAGWGKRVENKTDVCIYMGTLFRAL